MSKLALLKELWMFMKVRKKFWLLPIFVLFFILAVVLIFVQTSPLAPFLYTIF